MSETVPPTFRPNPMDLGMHALTCDRPATELVIGAALEVAGSAPPLAGLRAHVAEHLPHLPVLTHRLEGPRLRARWVRHPAPDLDARIRERVVEPGGLEAAVADLIALPLPEQGPPWDLWLLRGHREGAHTLCYRAAHTTHDGVAVRNTLYALFGGAVPAAPASARPTLTGYLGALRAQLGSLLPADVWNDPGTPLTGERSRAWVAVSTERLREAAAPSGGTANDASLACLSHALRGWAAEHWPRGAGKGVSTVVMVDGRRPAEHDRPGNLFAFAPITLPCQLPAFDDQLAAVVAATRAAKRPAARRALRTLMERTPARPYYWAARRLTTPERATVDTSHVAFPHPLRHGDAPVTAVRMFTWLPPHHPLSFLSCGYAGTTTVHFVTDRALPGLASLPGRWQAALRAAEGV